MTDILMAIATVIFFVAIGLFIAGLMWPCIIVCLIDFPIVFWATAREWSGK